MYSLKRTVVLLNISILFFFTFACSPGVLEEFPIKKPILIECIEIESYPNVDIKGEDIVLKFTESGGIAGMHHEFVLTFDYRAGYFSNGRYELLSQLTKSDVDVLINTIPDAGFFSFENEYAPDGHVSDGMETKITYITDTQSKTVNVLTMGNPPSGFNDIVGEIRNLINILRDRINSGEFNISRGNYELGYIIKEWPFSEKTPLSGTYIYGINANEDVFNYFRTYINKKANYVFVENGLLYEIYTNTNYNTPFSELPDGFRIAIQSGQPSVEWYPEIPVKLNELGEKGFLLTGVYFQIINSILKNNGHDNFFHEGELIEGNTAYRAYFKYFIQED